MLDDLRRVSARLAETDVFTLALVHDLTIKLAIHVALVRGREVTS